MVSSLAIIEILCDNVYAAPHPICHLVNQYFPYKAYQYIFLKRYCFSVCSYVRMIFDIYLKTDIRLMKIEYDVSLLISTNFTF